MKRDEVIEVYKGVVNPKIREAFEALMPELRESEDEKARKEIISYLKSSSAISNKKWIAYLEKQKEQKPAEKQDYSGLTDLERAIHRGFLVAGVENVPVTIIKETAQECLAHIDKPAEWSEEDEFFFDCLVDKIEINKDSCGLTTGEVQFLRNLRSRPIKADNWKPTEEQMAELLNALTPGKDFDCDILAELYNELKKTHVNKDD